VVALVTVFLDDTRPQGVTNPQECRLITDGGSRLVCYDRLLSHAPADPAKGATAPLGR
jgi:hypothetical protein